MLALLRRRALLAVAGLAFISIWGRGEAWESKIPFLHRAVPTARAQPIQSPAVAPEVLMRLTSGERLAIWVLLVVMTPILTAGLASRLLAWQSNRINLALLLGYTGLDIAAGYAIAGEFAIAGIPSAIGYLLVLAGLVAWNLWMLSTIARLSES